MQKINITVQENIVTVKYQQEKKTRELEWEDNRNISQKFLLRLDKINNCNKHKSNCLFTRNSDSSKSPTEFVLKRIGSESTTWRIVLATLKALEWAGKINLVTK